MKKTPEEIERIKSIERTANKIAYMLEKSRIYEYMDYVGNTKKMIRNSFFSGLMRGLGAAIGFTLLGAGFMYLLTQLAASNTPYIARFVAEIIHIAEGMRN